MAIGSKRSHGGDEYIFIDGKAMRSDEILRIEVDAPGAAESTDVPGMGNAAVGSPADNARAARGGGKQTKKKWSAKRALRELDSGDAFETNGEAGELAVSALFEENKRITRRIGLVLGAILLVVVLFSLTISVNWQTNIDKTLYPLFYDPWTVLQAIGWKIYLSFGDLLGFTNSLTASEVATAIPGYADIVARANVTFTTLVCGFLLAIAGMLYQNVFKNPLASPTMLGVSAGVRIGTIILVVNFGTAALTMQLERYAYCYIGGILILLLVLGFSKILAKGRTINVADMLIVGSIIAQMLQVVSQYYLSEVLDDDAYEVFYEITTGARTDPTEWYGIVFLLIIIAVTVIPIVLARFRMNSVAFDDGDARLMGVDPRRMRVFVLSMGTIAILAAQIHVGVISMVALVVPFLVRYIVGSEFGKQLLGNMLLGPIMLLVCRDICAVIPFVGTGLSLEMVVGFVALPVYVWMMALGRKGWE